MITTYATLHARQRAIERLGFEPTNWDWRQAALDIMNTKLGLSVDALFMAADDGYNGEIWMVRIATRQARVVWNPMRAWIVTVLPLKGRTGYRFVPDE